MAKDETQQVSTSPTGQSSSQDSINNQTQAPTVVGLKSTNGYNPMFPAIVPGLFPHQQNQEQMNHGPGLYAVSVPPYMQSMAGFPPNTLIPFTYNLPTERSTQESGVGTAEQGQPGEVPQQQQQAGIQRQIVVRRFQIAIQVDPFLILKLIAVVFLFNQDGSRQRLAVLIFFASLIYLYQTGALAPVVRWLSRGMQRAVPRPHQPPRPNVRADNPPAAAGAQGNEDAGLAEGQHLIGENENHQANVGNRAIENEHAGEPGPGEVGNRWWRIAKEIKLIVFGFITSLLPGFHNID